MKLEDKYRLIESVVMSWWDSLPEEMKKELNDIYNR